MWIRVQPGDGGLNSDTQEGLIWFEAQWQQMAFALAVEDVCTVDCQSAQQPAEQTT